MSKKFAAFWIESTEVVDQIVTKETSLPFRSCMLQCSVYALHLICAVSNCIICQLQLRYVTVDGVYLLFPLAYSLPCFLLLCTEQQNTGA